MNNNFKLCRSITQIVPFEVTKQIVEQKHKSDLAKRLQNINFA